MRLSMLDPVRTNDNVMTLLQLVLYDEGRVFWFWLRCSTIDMLFLQNVLPAMVFC